MTRRRVVAIGAAAVALAVTLTIVTLTRRQSGPVVVTFPDPKLDAAVRKAINKPTGDIMTTDLVGVGLAELRVCHEGIQDLSGLECCTDLTDLDLDSNALAQPGLLERGAKRLGITLHLDPVVNLWPLKKLTNLTRLDLSADRISDVSALSGLTNLTTLDLRYNNISDVSALSGLTKLMKLELSGNNISDVSTLSALTNLTRLDLSSNDVSDVSPLGGLTNLRALELSFNRIPDVSPLAGLTTLKWLYVSANQIVDVGPLVSNSGLGEGDTVLLEGNQLSPEALLRDIPALKARGVNVRL